MRCALFCFLGGVWVVVNGRDGSLNQSRLSLLSRLTIPTHPSTYRAVERLCAKLEAVRGSGEAVEIGEMFRHLTLQVRRG